MKPISELGMTDIASRSRSDGVWKLGVSVFVLVILYVVVRNYLFIKDGMFDPDFSVIHRAYEFNLGELGWLLFAIAILFGGLAVTWASVRRPLVILSFIFAFLGADVFALRYYVTHVEPEHLVIKRVRLETPKLRQPLRLLHISDIQAGEVGDYQREIFAQIAILEPDIILNTGDFLQVVEPATFEKEWAKLHALIAEVNPRYGTYGAYGDTERELYRIKPADLEPLRILSSRSETVQLDGGQLSILGLSLYQSRKGDWAMRSIDDWLKASDPNEFRIVFGHAPDYVMGLAEKPIDLCLAGHTHGGQVRLPFLGPLVIDSNIPKEWSRGFRRVGIPHLNVSAGAGSNRHKGLPPMRFNCPTEMTLIELVPIKALK
ncbi:MAG: metallophosphoesterase [Lentimonas sp.]